MVGGTLANHDMMYHYATMKKNGTPRKIRSRLASRHGDWLDGMAVCASVTCMIHCLALPLLLAALPAFADKIDPGERFHAIVLALAIPTSAFALLGGWRKHRAFVPLLVGAAGLTLMAIGILFAAREILETAITVSGSLLLAGAHIDNWRNRRTIPSAALPSSSR